MIILGTVSKAGGWDVKSGLGGVRGVITPVSALPFQRCRGATVGSAFSRSTDAGWAGAGGDLDRSKYENLKKHKFTRM